jgi:hypothetical protein
MSPVGPVVSYIRRCGRHKTKARIALLRQGKPAALIGRCETRDDAVVVLRALAHHIWNAAEFFQGVTMPSLDAFALRRSGLNEFLFASVGSEPSGLTLSLLSVFARQGDDPWKEAEKLVGLPKRDAIESVAQTLVRMPRSVWTLLDATAIATHLVALLPTRLGDAVPQPSIDNRRRVARIAGIGIVLVAVAFVMAST